MNVFAKMQHPTTLRGIFTRRLVILLTAFSVVISVMVAISYQTLTEKKNHDALNDTLAHMIPRIKDQERRRNESANPLLNIIDWSGIAGLNEPLRSAKLQAFFTAQSESLGYEGIVFTDARTGKVIFNYWSHAEKPNLDEALFGDQPLWLDQEHFVLYSRIKKPLRIANGEGDLNVSFFRAWDSGTLNRLGFPHTTSYISLGSRPLLSSAGNLALELTQPTSSAYSKMVINGAPYQEGSVEWAEVDLERNVKMPAEVVSVPLRLVVRMPITNILPLQQLLAVSVGITLLLGLIIFFIFGRWLGRIGSRLDMMTSAVLQFQYGSVEGVVEDHNKLLDVADANKHDQISVIAQELSTLMVTAGKRDEEQRAYIQTLDLLQDAVIEFTPDGRLLRATDAWKVLTGIDNISECGIANCVHAEDSAEVLEQMSGLAHSQKQQVSIRFRMRRLDEKYSQYWVEGRFAAVTVDGVVTSIRGVVRDITASYLQERQITHMALHDALTDLPNRVLMEDRLEMAITRAARNQQCVALGFIDLDHFKQVNDTFGHKVGDRLLKEVTTKLSTVLRSTDTLARWGGDEFVVLCPDLKSLEDAREITTKLAALTSENILIDGTEFPFTFSAGFAVYPDDASNSETLLSQADRAMFYAKAQGRNNIQFFNAIAAKEQGRQSFYIQSRLASAIKRGEIQAWLQPLISTKTGEVIGSEVLARWFEPEQGWVPPSVFIPMAESMGMIDEVGQLVWQQALLAIPKLPVNHRLSINLSKRQLFSSTIVQQFCDDIERANIKPQQIMLEITEGIALSDVDYARERIAELDAKGFGIAVDDFGVGYSSLSQLHEIPVDELKLDISFIKRIHEQRGLGMVTAIVAIAKSLDLECVAEGVEDVETADLLRNMGVEVLQGYLFAKAMPINEYIAWLTTFALVKSFSGHAVKDNTEIGAETNGK